MLIRSKAPLRIGFAGGGTDVSPFSDLYGGNILNATVNMYAHATIEPADDGMVTIEDTGINERLQLKSAKQPETNGGKLELLKGVYNRILRDYVKEPLSLKLTVHVDVPPGSGLGSSSTLVVATLAAFAEWLNLPFGEYNIAHLAYEIERKDLKMVGGKQDQYAAAFGGFNFMEFYGNDKVIVNPLRIKRRYVSELESSILLYHTGTSRLSHTIIEEEIANVTGEKEKPLDAMRKLKEEAILMKEALLKGELYKIGEILNYGWEHKKMAAGGISNKTIDDIYDAALKAGATGGKISGAGGGGYMIFYCPGTSGYSVKHALAKFGGRFERFNFVEEGVISWKA